MSKIIYPELSYIVQGAIYEVYNELRYLDISEKGWENALLVALRGRNIEAERQVKFKLMYKGYQVGLFFVDIVAANKLIIELKTIKKLRPIDMGQVITYLKATAFKLGILVNFGNTKLEIKRVPNFVSERSPVRDSTNYFDGLLYPELTKELRTILYEVHNVLGPGFMHMHYRRATQLELRWHHIPYELRRRLLSDFVDTL